MEDVLRRPESYLLTDALARGCTSAVSEDDGSYPMVTVDGDAASLRGRFWLEDTSTICVLPEHVRPHDDLIAIGNPLSGAAYVSTPGGAGGVVMLRVKSTGEVRVSGDLPPGRHLLVVDGFSWLRAPA